ncbi:hypothetical protein FIM10_04010 [Sphingomonadales bacterium 56]|uniref:hypothetical protein n=1 Tax=unclassified Sphingobium TaxID=2611147 RepID=UPI001919A775|nr:MULTISPECIES: hypothetical protein [unclassified Sphingobium]MBY2927840.1 hypothetical protein [Sphingomonadales bacterium 56]MBY2957940.1 hypothetical protein [Sphingomonadales bacterium 58]CAD7336044.1 hypothetical protein SPHS6_00813 [Sphingobium sp. S6]CAD7336107.1 hypothetical protein SPHS8_00853 [Sphingobium sp. S8]
MDPALKAALAQPAVLLFGALKIELPGYTLRLVDGSANLVIGGETYVGKDPTFGTIAEMSELGEEIGDSAPEVTVGLYPPDVTAAATLSHPNMQGSRATLMVGAVDPISGLVIGIPEILFLGEIDVPTIVLDQQGARKVEYTIVSVFERMFEVEEGQRASNGWHQSIWPGDLGLEHMNGTDVNLYWGARPPQGNGQKSGLAGWFGAAQKAQSGLRI